ncbi:hypothetical protein KCMC57_up41920 [Kitasatospora sp. CMC57]|uniref:Uncharacterized protein n=1 Tax=Kitasatospora sp. CMC57 TaxID=3231513 RepID=A0AB33K8S7_9ACTN
MSRPTIAQLVTGILTVVVAAAVLLAVSASRGVFEIAVLVAFSVALGTLATALLMTVAAQRRTSAGHRPQPRPTTAPEYAAQR